MRCCRTRLRWPRVGLPPMAHAPLHLFGALSSAATLARPLQDGGWWAWPLALAAHGVVLWRLAPAWPQRRRATWCMPSACWSWPRSVRCRAARSRPIGAMPRAPGPGSAGWSCPRRLLMALPRPAAARRWPVSAAPAAYQWIAVAGAGRRPAAVDAAGQYRLQRLGPAAAARAAAQPARPRRRRGLARGLVVDCAATRARAGLGSATPA